MFQDAFSVIHSFVSPTAGRSRETAAAETTTKSEKQQNRQGTGADKPGKFLLFIDASSL